MGNPISVTLKPGGSYNFPSGFNTIQIKNDSTTQRGKVAIVFSNGNEEGKTINPNSSVTISNQQMLSFEAENVGQTDLFIKVTTA